jgi:hypothetical protein
MTRFHLILGQCDFVFVNDHTTVRVGKDEPADPPIGLLGRNEIILTVGRRQVTGEVNGAATRTCAELEHRTARVWIDFMSGQKDPRTVRVESNECAFGRTREQVVPRREHRLTRFVVNTATKLNQGVQLFS